MNPPDARPLPQSPTGCQGGPHRESDTRPDMGHGQQACGKSTRHGQRSWGEDASHAQGQKEALTANCSRGSDVPLPASLLHPLISPLLSHLLLRRSACLKARGTVLYLHAALAPPPASGMRAQPGRPLACLRGITGALQTGQPCYVIVPLNQLRPHPLHLRGWHPPFC